MAENVMTGARARFFLNGQPLGWATGVTVTEDIVQEPIMTLNQLAPAEHVTTAYTVQLQAQVFKVPTKDLVAAGLWPGMGAGPDDHKRLLLDFPEMSAEIWDTYLSLPVAKIYRVKPRTRSIQFQARGIIATQCTFVAIFYSDEGTADT